MRAELLARYRQGPDVVQRALDRVDLDQSIQGWTPRQIVHHLADATMVAAVRLRRLLAEDRPAISGYDEEHYASVLHYDRPIGSSLAAFKASLESSAELLESLSDDEWERLGTHDEYPDGYSIDLWLERQAAHVHEHAEQIARCRRS
jgi:hypothetical protein